MNYKLLSERDISSLDYLLTKSGFKTKKQDNFTIDVSVPDKLLNNFIQDVSIYISTICYKSNYKKYLSRRIPNIEERLIDKIATLDVKNNENKIYMVQNIQILLNEYLKNNDILHLDSFLIFNATGFNKDISFLAQMYSDSYEDDLNNCFCPSNDDELSSKEESLTISTSDILDFEHVIKTTKQSIELPDNLINIKRIDLLEKNNKIMLLADETKKLDLNILKTLLCLNERDEHIDEITIIYILVGISTLFDIEQVVIHRNLSKDVFEYFLRNLLLLKDFGSLSNIKIFKCKENNCPKCNLK